MAFVWGALKETAWRFAFALRESGQALERVGCRLQGVFSHEELRECLDGEPHWRSRAGRSWPSSAPAARPHELRARARALVRVRGCVQ